MGVAQDYYYNRALTLLNGVADAYPTLQYAALSTPAASIGRSAVLADVQLAFPDLKSCGAPTIHPYVDSIPPYDSPGPITTPEKLPYSQYPAPGTWHNGTADTVHVLTLAIVAGDKILLWGPVAGSLVVGGAIPIDSGHDWTPAQGIVLQICQYTTPEANPIDAANPFTDAVIVKLTYETDNHQESLKHMTGTPHQLKWSDISDPTLGPEFLRFAKRFERLLYAWCGSPVYENPDTHVLSQWYNRKNPRCNWWPETWQKVHCGSDADPDCNNYIYSFSEYVARGINASGIPLPHVPITSRSVPALTTRFQDGDWKKQLLDPALTHDGLYFPRMSVTRYDGAEVFDPQGHGWFGGDPAHVGASTQAVGGRASVETTGEAVLITYTPPSPTIYSQALVANGGFCKLNYNGTEVAMTATGTTFTYSIPIQEHNTRVKWFIHAQFQSSDPGPPPPVVRYEPGGASAPDTDHQYEYVAFTHFNYYANGLPCYYNSKDTDQFYFLPDETIQYQLLNMYRFALSYMGLRFHHSPRLRSDIPICCLDLPIKFRWSGASQWPLHVNGGKDGVKPLHNRDDLGTSDATARRSWRGAPYQYSRDLFGNIYFPQDRMEASWERPNEIAELAPIGDGSCVNAWTGGKRGLQSDDMIEAVHLKELIAACDYLYTYGLWQRCRIKRRPVTPNDGLCGTWISDRAPTPPPDPSAHLCHVDTYGSANLGLNPGTMCFASCSSAVAGTMPVWPACVFVVGSYTCTNFTRPDWAWCDVDNPTTPADDVCRRNTYYTKNCTQNGTGWTLAASVNCTSLSGYNVTVTDAGSCGSSGNSPLDGGQVHWTCDGGAGFDKGQSCTTQQCGWSGYVCGPRHNPLGCDSTHGNNRLKPRTNYHCTPPDVTGGGVNKSLGNQLGDVSLCALNIESTPFDPLHLDRMDFETVQAFTFAGWANYAQCQSDLCTDTECSCYDAEAIPKPPGYTSWFDWSTPPAYMCLEDCSNEEGGTFISTGLTCKIGLTAECGSNQAWCSIDLHLETILDDDGLHSHDYARLYDYDLTSADVQKLCPCDTDERPSTCGAY